MPEPATALPIEPLLPRLRETLRRETGVVLQAPPGAGKTTRVPLALLHEPWLGGRRIVMLEPRRLAARAAARWMAASLGEEVGGTVGYRVRHDSRVGPRTRVEVVTEGILTRMLLADPALETVGLVIFDEFHERSIHADLGLALTLQTRGILRTDLRIVVMSATLDGEPIAALLGGSPVITGEGRSFPVEIRHIPRRSQQPIEPAVASAVRRALAEQRGDLLVFLPGAGEIRRVGDLLSELAADVVPLHGNLSPEAQDRAIRPGSAGRRKVVLATSIAETSLTIEGVGAVIDAGLARVPRYSPRSGMTRLATIRVSRASAEQRRGRAGRLGPGVCYRLWGQAEEQSLVQRGTPEILEADLAPLALDLAAAGIAGPLDLSWLDPPPAGAFAEARGLLAHLGALDADGRITPHGRAMAGLSLHPRLAHMVMRGRALGALEQACELAALLSERDLIRRPGDVPEADIRVRLDILRGRTQVAEVNREALRRARADVRSCVAAGARGQAKPLGQPERAATTSETSPGVLLALAYPDRIAQRRPDSTGRYLLRNGSGAFLEPQALGREEYLVAAELEGKGRESRILLAAPLSLDEIERYFSPAVQRHGEVEWDPGSRGVVARKRERLGALVLREGPWPDPDPVRVRAALLDGIRRGGIEALPWDEASRRVRARLAFLHRLDPEWPNVSDEALLESLEVWLEPHLGGVRRLDQLGALSLGELLLGRVGWDRRSRVDQLAPTHLQVPSGSRVPLDYSDPDVPVLAVRLQEVFGLLDTPRIAGGRVPVTLHLLSPARRPVQVTRDLAGFWRTTYFEVRKDLRGRYPRHPWPEDPLTAPPTRRVKPRGPAAGT